MNRQETVLNTLLKNKFAGWPGYLRCSIGSFWTCLPKTSPTNRESSAGLLRPWSESGKMIRNPENYNTLGKLTALLHQITPPNVLITPDSKIQRQILQKKSLTLPDPTWYLNLLAGIPSFDELPKCLIHGDIGPHNTLINKNKQLIIIDWDNSGYSTRIFDLAFPLIWMFVGKNCDLREENAKAFYKSYLQINPIQSEERESIFSAALFFALKYIFYRDMQINIRRIKTALLHRSTLESWYSRYIR
ncbi:phosphotransferase [bacterium]|nr:phosphotransferase [bacterium]